MKPNLKTLTVVDRERISDSVLKIQSVRSSLEHLDQGKIPSQHEIEECLDNADHNLRTALGYKKDKSKH
jgi:hypothetical protein